MDDYYYARDHENGPGAWCVRGPHGYHVSVGDKNCAYILGKMLSGRLHEAASMACDVARLAISFPDAAGKVRK